MSDVGDDDDEPDIPLDLWAALVYEARRGRRMTQPQLARAAGVAQQTISKLERGRLCPHDRVKLRLAAALDVQPSILFPWPSLSELGVSPRSE
jgi:DNA-binding XRE family transcriptional regulator